MFKLDRLGRSLKHLIEVLEDLENRGDHFQTTEEGLSTKGSTGKMVLRMLAVIAEFEAQAVPCKNRKLHLFGLIIGHNAGPQK